MENDRPGPDFHSCSMDPVLTFGPIIKPAGAILALARPTRPAKIPAGLHALS